MDYEHKIQSAIRLLQSIPQDGPIELCYSGGKDSDVILELAKMAGIPFEAIYKNTTIDPPGTIAHAKSMGAKIVHPKESFMQLIVRKGMPSRFARFCCEKLKEYKIHDRAIQGIRRNESVARAKRYKEQEMCRVYSGGEKVKVYLPILEWTNDDVVRFISERGIKCHPMYYDEQGHFHVERRLGCIGCPLQSDKGRREFMEYPKLLMAEISAYQKWLDNHVDTERYKFLDGKAYNLFFYIFFCNGKDDYVTKVGGVCSRTM